MKLLYIGQFTPGTTSRMRGETLRSVLKPEQFDVADIHIPFFSTSRLFRSLGFRFKKGPLIWKINQYVMAQAGSHYDLIWVDKGVFVTAETLKQLRQRATTLVHYTPDTAFYENSSDHFFRALPLYDYVITTKSFDLERYKQLVAVEKMLYVPQGFDKTLHYSRNRFEDKEPYVAFIGLNEPSREQVVTALLQNGIPVRLAGKGWQRYVANNRLEGLEFLGESLVSEAYVTVISEAMFSLGLLSKRFPELHTTRTFEIPACGTALLTERNAETAHYYSEDEVIFYETPSDLIEKIRYYLSNPSELKALTLRGYQKVHAQGFDYQSQLALLCEKMGLR
ncbi:MAG: glycosyltransferase [Bacteroidales bacterium]